MFRRLETSAADASPLQTNASQKPPKKGARVSRLEGVVLQVIFYSIIIFLEGGGQPLDIGYIFVGSGTIFEVFKAKRDGGHVVHSIRSPPKVRCRKHNVFFPPVPTLL